MSLLTLLELRRRELGQSQVSLSQIARIRQTRLSEIETGKGKTPTDAELDRLARALAMPPGQLLQRVKVLFFDGTVIILPDNRRSQPTPEPVP